MDVGKTPTDRLLEGALTGLATRQRVIGNNVANVDTPGFKAARVDFEQALRRASGRSEELAMMAVPNAVSGPENEPASVRPEVVTLNLTTRRGDGNNVDVDQEMVELAQTNLTFNALAQLMSGRMQILRTVITEGRR